MCFLQDKVTGMHSGQISPSRAMSEKVEAKRVHRAILYRSRSLSLKRMSIRQMLCQIRMRLLAVESDHTSSFCGQSRKDQTIVR